MAMPASEHFGPAHVVKLDRVAVFAANPEIHSCFKIVIKQSKVMSKEQFIIVSWRLESLDCIAN